MNAVWATVRLGDILTERRETPSEADIQAGDIRIVDKVSFSDGRIHLRYSQETKTGMIVVRPGDILVSGINAAKGAIAIHNADAPSPIAATIHYGAYKADESQACAKFLWWMLRSNFFRELLSEHVPGGIKTELKSKRLLPIPIPLPPLDEQRRIVAHIEDLAAKLDEARRLRRMTMAESDRLHSVAISKVISRCRCNHIALSDLIDDSSLRNGKSIKSTPADAGIRCLTVGSVRDGRVDTAKSKPVPMTPQEARPYLLSRGDVFVVRGNGSKELCGRAGIVTDDVDEVVFPDLFIRVSLPPDTIDPYFFVAVWNAPEMRSWLEEEAKTTSGIWKINQGHILAARIPLPPIDEQRRVVADLDILQVKFGSVEALQAETAAELDAMLPAILDKAFKGEL